ncbi:ribonuclease Y [bacterium]|nr:ribonuclease Y [bacterium]
MTVIFISLGAASLGIGFVLGYIIRQKIAQKQANSIEAKLKVRLEKVKEEAKKIVLQAKDKAERLLEESRKEEKKRKEQLTKMEERLIERESLLDKRQLSLDKKEEEAKRIYNRIQEVKAELEKLQQSELESLEKIAKMTQKEAKEELFRRIEEEHQVELVESLKKLEQQRREELEQKAREIMVSAIERYSHSNVSEVTTSVVDIPSDDVKGKIIGREGRNIHHFEKLTGVEILIDDSPNTILLSSFDPVRRAIAKLALRKLIADGRIQPAKIEEKVLEAQAEIREEIKKAGEEAAYETGVLDLPPEIIHLLGRLKFRTSYGQNALVHSKEVALLAGALATELGANVAVAKKAGLLHDIGKAVDQEIEGTHLELGRKILMKYHVGDDVVKAMQSHHGDYPVETLEAAIVNCADAISASRPGARKDNLQAYLKRLADLEEIATAYKGVEKAYAISGGRELRVFVYPDKVDDLGALKLAKEIANKIEEELKYPGEIKVVVIRENRAIEIAR